MNKIYSKAEIDRLGEKIREESIAISSETIDKLQLYRTSHKESLSSTFNLLCQFSKKIHKSSIVTFRIKRFQSIIGKLERYPDMRFSRMWDIGGCRCIVRNENDVYKLKRIIELEPSLEIVKEYDYLKNPQEDGYQSLHLFVKHVDGDKHIEVQLRTLANHNWATLVEITDLLFDSRLKEYGENKDLLRFHFLLSNSQKLSVTEKYELANIIKEYRYFDKLSEVFSRNYLKVRKQWFAVETKSNHNFFIIEARKEDFPRISSFVNFSQAEKTYFSIYKSRPNANVILTHLQNPNYNQISIAYSNYMLTFHSFLSECFDILETLIVESLKSKKHRSFYRIYHLYLNLVFNHIENLVSEISEIQSFAVPNSIKNSRIKELEWKSDIQKQILKSNKRSKELQKLVIDCLLGRGFSNLINKIIMKLANRTYEKRVKKIFEKAFPNSNRN